MAIWWFSYWTSGNIWSTPYLYPPLENAFHSPLKRLTAFWLPIYFLSSFFYYNFPSAIFDGLKAKKKHCEHAGVDEKEQKKITVSQKSSLQACKKEHQNYQQ